MNIIKLALVSQSEEENKENIDMTQGNQKNKPFASSISQSTTSATLLYGNCYHNVLVHLDNEE